MAARKKKTVGWDNLMPTFGSAAYNELFGDRVTKLGFGKPSAIFGVSAKTAKTPPGTLNVVNYMAPDRTFQTSIRGALRRFEKGQILPQFNTKAARTKAVAVRLPGESRNLAFRSNVVAQNLIKRLPGKRMTQEVRADLDRLAGRSGTACSDAGGCADICLVDSGTGGATEMPTWGRLGKHAHFTMDKEAFVDLARSDVNSKCETAKNTRIIEGTYKGQKIKTYAGIRQAENEATRRTLLVRAANSQLGGGARAKPSEIKNIRVTEERVHTLAIRPNGTSDIAWETIKGKKSGRTLLEVEGLTKCDGIKVVFYDYTKKDPDLRQKAIKKLNQERAKRGEGPVNYSLTYSYDPTPRSPAQPDEAPSRAMGEGLLHAPQNALSLIQQSRTQTALARSAARYKAWSRSRRALDLGKQADPMGARAWSVAFAAEDEDTAKELLKPGKRWSLFPDVPVVDGDEHDLRFTDRAAVVVLKPKFDMIDRVNVDVRTGADLPSPPPAKLRPYAILRGQYNIGKVINSGAPSFFQRIAHSSTDTRAHANGRVLTEAQARQVNPYKPIGHAGARDPSGKFFETSGRGSYGKHYTSTFIKRARETETVAVP